GTGVGAAAAAGSGEVGPGSVVGAGVAGLAVRSTATWPLSTSSQLTWTGDGDPAGSTASTTPLRGSGWAGAAQSRAIGVRSKVQVPSSERTPSAEARPQSAAGRSRQAAFWLGPCSRFPQPLCVAVLRLPARAPAVSAWAPRAGHTGPAASSNRPSTVAYGRARPNMYE